jgi:RimJ/RimL family protein N-acetyltransferase
MSIGVPLAQLWGAGIVCPEQFMGADSPSLPAQATWRDELPVLAGHLVLLRELVSDDIGPLVDLLSIADASRFGIEPPVSELDVLRLVDGARRNRAAGLSFTYAITLTASGAMVGVVQVRQLDPSFETAEWEITLAPPVRGSGVFVEAARLVGSFAFASVGAYRIESRVLLHNGRAHGALRKIGAVQEGILRRATRRGADYLDQVLWSLLKDDWVDQPISPTSRVH